MRPCPGCWLSLLALGATLGCGGAVPGLADGAAAADAAADSDLGWPTVDPNPDAAVHGGPTFADAGAVSDAGAADDAAAPPTCVGKTGAAGERIVTIGSGGLQRTAILQVPASYVPERGAWLVLNFHGVTSDAWQQEVLSRMTPASEARGFIVAYPFGVQRSWNGGTCCEPAAMYDIDDAQFVRDLIAAISANYCVDPRRIYATGMSNGGILSHRLGCELADTLAAIAPVSGVFAFDPADCHPARPVPIIEFHGTADTIVPIGGTPIANGGYLESLDDTVATWRALDGCTDAAATIYAVGDATCVAWSACAQGSEVVRCLIDGGGHTWPGGTPVPVLGKTSTDLSATDTMLDFFAAHPLP